MPSRFAAPAAMLGLVWLASCSQSPPPPAAESPAAPAGPAAEAAAAPSRQLAPPLSLTDVTDEQVPEACRGTGELPEVTGLEALVVERAGGVGALDWDGEGGPDLVATAPGFGVPCILLSGEGGLTAVAVPPEGDLPRRVTGVTVSDGPRGVDVLLGGLGAPTHWSRDEEGAWVAGRLVVPPVGGTPWVTAVLDLASLGLRGAALLAIASSIPEIATECRGADGAERPCPRSALGPGITHVSQPTPGKKRTREDDLLIWPGYPSSLLASAFSFGDAPAVLVTDLSGYDRLYRFTAERTVIEDGWRSGLATGRLFASHRSYGADLADVDGDGHGDVIVATELDGIRLYKGDGKGFFVDRAVPGGTFGPTAGRRWYGALLEDLDLDGDPDIVATGDAEGDESGLLILRNDGGRFTATAAGNAKIPSARGAAVVDIDGDGDPDLAIALRGGGVRLVRNDVKAPGWLRVLRPVTADEDGRPLPNARVTVRWPDGLLQVLESRRARGYASASDPAIRFSRRGELPVGEPVLIAEAPLGKPVQAKWPEALLAGSPLAIKLPEPPTPPKP